MDGGKRYTGKKIYKTKKDCCYKPFHLVDLIGTHMLHFPGGAVDQGTNFILRIAVYEDWLCQAHFAVLSS